MRYAYTLDEPSFMVKNITVLDVLRNKNYKHSYSSGRIQHGFVYVLRGAVCDVFLQQKENAVHLKAGELIFIPKGCPYVCTYLEDETELRIVHFDTTDNALPSYLCGPTKIELPDVREAMNALFTPLDNHLAHHPFYYLSCLYRLLWQIDDSYTRPTAKYKRLQPALDEICAHPDSSEPISHYARLCHMSETNFRRLFRQHTGTSPLEYRNHVRLNMARAKLQSGEYNVFEAAQAVGFSNLSFFIRLYKKKFGHTPGHE